MKRKILVVAGTLVLLLCVATLAAFRPWATPLADKQSIDALFSEADKALDAYYATNKTYPDSIAVLRLQSNLAPHLRYVRTGKSSCKLVWFSFGDIRIWSSETHY